MACALCFAARAAAPPLDVGVRVQSGSSPLSVATMSAPTVVDWNSHGKKDLVVGQFTYGKIKVFLNQNTDADPVFSGGTFIKSGGVDITTSYG